MATRVEEAYGERDQTIDADGNVTEIAIPYLVFNAADEDAALAAARTQAKAKTVAGMALDSVEVEERINQSTWRVKAEYAPTESSSGDDEGGGGDEDSYSTSFDTGGGTMHMNQSLGTTERTPNDAPDFVGAIGVDAEGNKFRWQDASVKGANMKTDNSNDIINIDELNEAYARACPRNLAFRVAHGTAFDLGERVGFDPTSRQAAKSDAPNAVPLGVVQHFVQQPTAPFDVAFVFTFESFFCDFDHRGERRGA